MKLYTCYGRRKSSINCSSF